MLFRSNGQTAVVTKTGHQFDIPKAWPTPQCQNHSGKRKFDERAFLTDEGLLFSTEEAKERYLTLYIAGKVELHHENWFADIAKWQPINRMMRTSQTTPVEGIKIIEF